MFCGVFWNNSAVSAWLSKGLVGETALDTGLPVLGALQEISPHRRRQIH